MFVGFRIFPPRRLFFGFVFNMSLTLCFGSSIGLAFDTTAHEGLIWPYERSWSEFDQLRENDMGTSDESDLYEESFELDGLLHDVGYQCVGSCQTWLANNFWNPQTRVFCDGVIEQAIAQYVARYKYANYRFSAEYLANLPSEILKVSRAFGLDPFIMTGKIKRETNFRPDPKGGAAGLTQLTGIAILELGNQMGFRGPDYFRAGTDDVYARLYRNYLSPDEYNVFMDWLEVASANHTRRALRDVLRGEENVRFSLAAGAALLKMKLSIQEEPGNYNLALQAYNNEATKVAYARNVLSDADQLVAIAQKISRGRKNQEGKLCSPEVDEKLACLDLKESVDFEDSIMETNQDDTV